MNKINNENTNTKDTEDKGHYEEQVDYQYCSECGAKK